MYIGAAASTKSFKNVSAYQTIDSHPAVAPPADKGSPK